MTLKGAPIAMKKIQKTIVGSTSPVLRFSPTAWAKLLYLRDAGDTEIGGFGITPTDDLLFVEDIGLVNQSCTWVHVEFDDASVADFFDAQVDAGRRPEQFGRIWIHTHPGTSPQPSGTDEATFARVFGNAHWALMFILARGGQTYARLRFNTGPGGALLVPAQVDYSRPFAGSAVDLWQAEYLDNVSVPPDEPLVTTKPKAQEDDPFVDEWWRDAWGEYADFDHLPMEEPCGFIRDF
jgi:proteasome lid subunit RPN8/RPN11